MNIAVIGTGQVPFTGPTSTDIGDLGGAAARAAIANAGVSFSDIGIAVVGSAFDHPSIGQRVLLRLGLNGIPLVNVENACASSTAGTIEAIRWIELGAAEVALIVGVEKMATKFQSGPIALVDETDAFGAQGVTVPAIFGLIAERHMKLHGSTREDYARIALKNRRYAAHNPFARFRNAPTLEEILAAPTIASPIGRYDCCANGDGAAAIVIASASYVKRKASQKPVWIQAAELGGGVLGDRLFDDPMTKLARRAFERAGLGPNDVDVVECHDNFSIGELEAYERMGFCAEGEGHVYFRAGKSEIGGGGAAFNPGGGLLGRSHPAGATGCAQIASIFQQLRSEAGAVQHQDAKVGLVQTSGGGVMELQSNVTTVLIFTS